MVSEVTSIYQIILDCWEEMTRIYKKLTTEEKDKIIKEALPMLFDYKNCAEIGKQFGLTKGRIQILLQPYRKEVVKTCKDCGKKLNGNHVSAKVYCNDSCRDHYRRCYSEKYKKQQHKSHLKYRGTEKGKETHNRNGIKFRKSEKYKTWLTNYKEKPGVRERMNKNVRGYRKSDKYIYETGKAYYASVGYRYSHMKSQAKIRGFDYCEKESFIKWWDKTPNNCFYCSIKLQTGHPKIMKHVGRRRDAFTIDRCENEYGYLDWNIVKCCIRCNMIKSNDLSKEDMFIIGNVILHSRIQRKINKGIFEQI